MRPRKDKPRARGRKYFSPERESVAMRLKPAKPFKNAHWENRLLQRDYSTGRGSSAVQEWSVRIEHSGTGCYFPLQTMDKRVAAQKALSIYQMVRRRGWEVAYEQLRREVTLAVHWMSDPLAWTYTTFNTELETPSLAAQPTAETVLRLAIIEPDAGVRNALKHWLANHSGVVRVEAYSTPEQGIQAEAAKTTDLWLVNRLLPANQSFEQWARRTPKLCSLCYSVHEDSNQLFLATPGGASAYLLKRIHPDRLLEPLTGSGAACSLSSPDILSRARKYFEAAIAAAGIGAAVGDLETLTPREQELLAWLSKGYLDKEIATLLGISTWTVRGHLKNIFEKLKVHTRTEAVVKFLHK